MLYVWIIKIRVLLDICRQFFQKKKSVRFLSTGWISAIVVVSSDVLCLTGLIFTLLNRLFTSQFLFLLESSFSVVTSVSLLPPCCAGVFAGTLITHNSPLSFLLGIFCLCPWSTKSLVRFGYSFFFSMYSCSSLPAVRQCSSVVQVCHTAGCLNLFR